MSKNLEQKKNERRLDLVKKSAGRKNLPAYICCRDGRIIISVTILGKAVAVVKLFNDEDEKK